MIWLIWLLQGEIRQETLREYLQYIASDELEGRLSGSPGETKVTEFIAKKYREAGLKPLGEDGSYFQHFDTPRKTRARNTIALLEGTDPELKKQHVLIGAHHDHLGTAKEGEDRIYNGADDNGSGTATLLAIVKSLAGRPSKRSIVFMTFGAEEWSCVGSRHYVEHPIVPLESTSVMINLDMVGRGSKDRPTNVCGMATVQTGLFRETVQAAADKAGLKVKLHDSYGHSSDMAPFGRKQVPVVYFFESGPCPDYHKVSDHADKIHYEYMSAVGDVVLMTLVALGDTTSSIAWNPEYKHPEPGPRLGINADEEPGALRLTTVSAGSVGEKAGLKPGDLLVDFAGPLPAEEPLKELRRRLASVKKGVPVALEFIRDGEKIQAQAVWPKE